VELLLPKDILGGDGLLEDSFFLWKKSETAWIILLRRSRSLDFFLVSFAPSLRVKDTLTSGSKQTDVFVGRKKGNIIKTATRTAVMKSLQTGVYNRK
jgi:hypothetical protein